MNQLSSLLSQRPARVKEILQQVTYTIKLVIHRQCGTIANYSMFLACLFTQFSSQLYDESIWGRQIISERFLCDSWQITLHFFGLSSFLCGLRNLKSLMSVSLSYKSSVAL